MNAIEVHDAFTPAGSDAEPMPAVSVSAGAMWGEVYRKVCAGAGRYVQGGGCLTVGVAGLIQSGGFGSLRSEERRVGKECVVRVDLGGRRIIKKNTRTYKRNYM